MSWPLWYLYALIGSTIMVGIFKRLKCNIEIIVAIGIVISVLGYYFESIHNNHMMNLPTWIYSIVNVYYSYFCTTRNFFFFGFPCLTFGLIIAKYEKLLLKNKYIFIIILPFAIWLYINDFILTKIVVSAIIIIITLSVNNLPDNPKVYLNLRRIGVLVYFSHMYFVFFVTELWNLRFLANFIIVSSLVTIFACFLLFLMNKKNMGFLKKIISS